MQRIVYCDDALAWLNRQPKFLKSSLVTSLPDFSEFPRLNLEQWQFWFKETAKLIMSLCPDEGVTVFFQSDIKREGAWIDKGYLCQKAAEELGHSLLGHKIVCKASPGRITYGSPSYSHLLFFSKNLRLDKLNLSTADVLPEMGEKTWKKGMGLLPALTIAEFISTQTDSETIINPFCGEGSVLAAANSFGLAAIGIERSPKRADMARRLEVSSDRKNWQTKSLLGH